MQKSFFKQIKRNQKGFTLVELLVVVAISGILIIGVTSSIFQTLTVNASSTARMHAIKQLEQVIDRVRLDVQMAQQIDINPDQYVDPNAFLILSWKDWDDNTLNVVKYYWEASGQLSRSPSEGTINAI
jgi:prepilin-type N-terminal cleavage/methylation domain-containing protein